MRVGLANTAPNTAPEKVHGHHYGAAGTVDYPLAADEWEVLESKLSAGPMCIAFTSMFIGQLITVMRAEIGRNDEDASIADLGWRFLTTFEGSTLLVLACLAVITLFFSLYGRKHREQRAMRKFLHDVFESARREKRKRFGEIQ